MIYYWHALLFLLLIYDIYLIYSGFSSRGGKYPPFVPAPSHSRKIIIRELRSFLQDATRPLHIIDPGCGIGSLLLPLASRYPQHHFSGIEWNKILYQICRFRSRQLTNLNYYYQDMLTFDYSTADIIVCFVVPKLIPDLQQRIIATAQPGTILWSLDCAFSQLNEIDCFISRLFWIKFKIHCYRL